MTTLSVDEDDTITATCTVERGTILKNLHTGYVVRRNVSKDIIELSVMERQTVAAAYPALPHR